MWNGPLFTSVNDFTSALILDTFRSQSQGLEIRYESFNVENTDIIKVGKMNLYTYVLTPQEILRTTYTIPFQSSKDQSYRDIYPTEYKSKDLPSLGPEDDRLPSGFT